MPRPAPSPVGANNPASQAAVPAVPVDPAAGTQPAVATPAQTPVAGPATANDQDVIEPEWVKKAEEVIDKTAGKPHEEEEQVEDLQIDYLQKRYGKTVKKSEDG